MESEIVGWWLGAAPGLALALRTWWQRQQFSRHMSAVASVEQKWNDSDLRTEQKFNLWFKPHCFVRRADSPAMAEARSAILAFRRKTVRGLWGGGILAVIGGLVGWLLARAIA